MKASRIYLLTMLCVVLFSCNNSHKQKITNDIESCYGTTFAIVDTTGNTVDDKGNIINYYVVMLTANDNKCHNVNIDTNNNILTFDSIDTSTISRVVDFNTNTLYTFK